MLGSSAFRMSVTPGGALAGPWVKNPLWRTARAVPSLDLPFADTKSLVDAVTGQSLVTFTRASSGTSVGSDGLIKTATTNLLLRSEEFDNASWIKPGLLAFGSGSTANAIAAPNGSTAADLLTEDTSTGQHRVYQTVSGTVNANAYTLSVYVKAKERTRFYVGIVDSPGFSRQGNAIFNLSNGTVVSASAGLNGATGGVASIQDVGNGWYRCSYALVLGGTNTAIFCDLNIVSAGSTISYTGDGISGIYLWGAQLEQSSTVGEYIPTASTINSAPRFDHNPTTGESLGLLVEEQRTNNVLQSEDFATTWILNNISVSSNTVVAPDGTTTADTISPPTDGLTTPRFLRQNPALTTQQAYTLSVFVKAGTATTNGIALYVSDSTATNNFRGGFNIFNLNTSATGTGWATPTATIVPYSNGWYRCILSGVTSTAHTSLRAIIYLSLFGNVADNFGSVHIWGAQLEVGSFPTSYIPTTGAAATRSADVASITGTAFSSWYRQDEGSFYASFSHPVLPVQAGARIFVAQSAGTDQFWGRMAGGSSVTLDVTVSGISQAVFGAGNPSANETSRVAIAARANDFFASRNGTGYGPDLSGTMPSALDRLGIGMEAVSNGSQLNGTIRRLVFFPQRLPNSTIQAITQ